MSDTYDVAIIGGGPGGYVAAIRAGQLGLKVVCIEGRGTLGGTCLNVGCIPSKALLHASEMFHDSKEEGAFAEMGIKAEKVSIDLKQLMAYKDKTVKGLTSGIEGLFKKNKVDYVKGWGSFKDKNTIEVKTDDGTQTIKADQVIIATGSVPTSLPGIEIDEDRVVSSTGALSLPKVPKHLVVIGGGYIGLEMGSVWKRLGADVTVVEYMDSIVPAMDKELGKEFSKILKKQGLDIRTSTKVTGVDAKKTKVNVTIEPADGGDEEKLDADYVLVAVGRKPNTDGLGLENIGLETNDKGQIATDEHWQTKVEGVFAIGDVIDGPMLAHKAEEEGIAAAEIIAGKVGHVNYNAIPAVVYTMPEVASVGKTEEQLKDEGVDYKVGKFSFMGNAKAKVELASNGFIKILADAKTDRVLGVHIIGPDAGNLIAEATLAMEFDASAEDIALTCHAHPTLSEAMKEAAMAVEGNQIHM